MPMKLSTLRIFVTDLVAAQNFYEDLLGLPRVAGGAEFGYCVFEPGAVQLVVEVVMQDAPPEDRALVGRFTGASFAVDDVRATHARLAALGVVFTGLPEAQEWGGVLATLRDPAENELQIVQMPRADSPKQ